MVAAGVVEVEDRRQAVQHTDGGTIAELRVKEGDAVEAGDLLLRFDTTFLDKEIGLLRSQRDEMLTRRARLEAERDGAERITFPAELRQRAMVEPDLARLMDSQGNLLASRNDNVAKEIEQLEERSAQIKLQSDGLQAKLASTRQQLALIGDELADLEKLLADGLTTQDRVNALRRAKVQFEGAIGELDAAIAENAGKLAEINIARLRVSSANSERALTELRDVEPKIIEVSQQLNAREEMRARTEVRAPVGGLIFGLQVAAAGAVVRPAEPVMFVIPSGSPLMVATRIDPAKIDQVAEGQPAILMFSQFGRDKTPELESAVTRLSSDIYTDKELGFSYYRAELELSPDELRRLEQQGMRVIPGMPAEALIRTGERSPLTYLLKPLADQLKITWLER